MKMFLRGICGRGSSIIENYGITDIGLQFPNSERPQSLKRE